MFRRKSGVVSALVLLACGAMSPARLAACDIPVFRYALERWPAEAYRVVVFHRGTLHSSEDEIVSALRQAAAESGGNANFTVRLADLSGELDDATGALWQAQDAAQLPRLVVAYPAPERTQRAAWSGPLSMSAAKGVMTSPVREEIARRLQNGESGVWILVESGDRAKDTGAARFLEAQLAKMPGRLTLPDLSSEPQWTGSSDGLQIRFSLVRVPQSDPAEDVLRAMLLGSEGDLERQHESAPIAFPVFGRGRCLYALVGRGINERNITDACAFLAGPCACEVKAENPGTDLLIDAAWDDALVVPLVWEVELSPLTTVSAQADESERGIEAPASSQPVGEQPFEAVPAEAGSHRLLLAVFVALGAIIVAVAVLSVAIKKRSPVE